jgi:hypothetical protein
LQRWAANKEEDEMNRVIEMVPVKTVIIILTGVGVVALAVLAVQAILTADPRLGQEVEPVRVEGSAPAAELAPRDEPALESDAMEADVYRGFITQAGEGVVPIDVSTMERESREALNYRGFITQVGEGWVHTVDAPEPESDAMEADVYRGFITQAGEGVVPIDVSTMERDSREALNYRGFITQVGEGRAQTNN